MFDITDWNPDERDVLIGWDDREKTKLRGEITDLFVNNDGMVGVLVKDAHNFSRGMFPMSVKLVAGNEPKEGCCVLARRHEKADELFKALAKAAREAKKATRADE